MKAKQLILLLGFTALLFACEKDKDNGPTPLNPDTAPQVSVDRFSSDAAHLFVRNDQNGFPDANEPVNFDMIPAFITKGLGPDGELIEYYNFDVMAASPAPIYVLFRTGEDSPVDGQLNIIDVIPGDPGYNDFWQVIKVTVPADYVANTVTSLYEINQKGYTLTPTNKLVNCPVVPAGSVASKRLNQSEDPGLTRGWYRNQVVFYFNFSEKELMVANGMIPTSDIYVSFNINPGESGGGPPSGFKTEDGMPTGQTHNVAETVPSDEAYSPLWDVQIYDNADFSSVSDFSSAQSVTILATDAVIVNCPVVSVQ